MNKNIKAANARRVNPFVRRAALEAWSHWTIDGIYNHGMATGHAPTEGDYTPILRIVKREVEDMKSAALAVCG